MTDKEIIEKIKKFCLCNLNDFTAVILSIINGENDEQN